MNRRTFVKTLPALSVLASTAGIAQEIPRASQELQPVTLPKPESDGGKSVLASCLGAWLAMWLRLEQPSTTMITVADAP